MAHLNLYVPDDLEAQLKTRAKARGKSVSAYVSELIHKDVAPSTDWSTFLASTWGKWEGDFIELKDSPIQLAEADRFEDEA